MKFKVTQIGCDVMLGEETVMLEDEQLGELTVQELELDSLEELTELLGGEVESVKLKETQWSRYDAELFLLCGKY
jgi:hypothetical protein